MKLEVEMCNPYIYWIDGLKRWTLMVNIDSGNVHRSISFTNKTINKCKKDFYKFCIQGILGEEMLSLFKEHKIHFKVYEKGEINQ